MSASKKIKLEEKTSVCGFIQHVSPIKTSRTNNKYFNATVQVQRDTFKKVACFDVMKHSTLVEASQARTPLKLIDVQIVPSRLDSAKTEVLVNYKSRVEVSRQLSFSYQKSTEDDHDSAGEKFKTLKEVQNTPEFNKVAVEVKILSAKEVSVQIVRELPIQKQEVIVGDSTATMKLTLWDEMVTKLEIGKSYRLNQLSTRLFQNVKTITATKATSIESIDDLVNCLQAPEDNDVIEKEGKITQVGLVMHFSCEMCKGKVALPDDDSKFIRCPSCKMKMAKETLQKSMNGTLCFSYGYQKVKLSIFSSTLFTMCIANHLSVDNVENIEDFLLSNSFRVAYSNETKNVQNIVHLTNVAGVNQ